MHNLLTWVTRLIAAYIMLQTLYFKFSGATESVYIFTKVGMEPWGRYGVGLGELIASVLLLIPRTSWLGGFITVGLMAGAIGMHVLVLGVVVFDDGGQLFAYAVIAFVCGAYNLWIGRENLLRFLKNTVTSTTKE